MDEWVALMKAAPVSAAFSTAEASRRQCRTAARNCSAKKYGKKGNFIGQVGTNPCGEIILQSKQFCNLSEVIARGRYEKTLLRKAKLATLLGTYQSTLTNFNYISKDWQENCREGAFARRLHHRPVGFSRGASGIGDAQDARDDGEDQ